MLAYSLLPAHAEILRVSLARIAQACGPLIEQEIPGGEFGA